MSLLTRRGSMMRKVIKEYPNYLCFTAQQADSTITMTKNGSPSSIALEYSTNRDTWYDFATSTGFATITLENIGDKVWIRGDNNSTFSESSSSYYSFTFTGKLAASGNINTLLDYTTIPNSLTPYCFYKLFYNGSKLTSAPELPATTLAEACYSNMFYACTMITGLITLPATKLAKSCYTNMFFRCSKLSMLLVYFTSWTVDGEAATTNWLKMAGMNATFVCPKGLTAELGDSRVPTNWDIGFFTPS